MSHNVKGQGESSEETKTEEILVLSGMYPCNVVDDNITSICQWEVGLDCGRFKIDK